MTFRSHSNLHPAKQKSQLDEEDKEQPAQSRRRLRVVSLKNRVLLNCFLGSMLGLASVGANAACTNVTNQISYTTIQPNEAVVGWGPSTVGNASCYAMVNATVTPDGNVYAPSLFIQKMVGGQLANSELIDFKYRFHEWFRNSRPVPSTNSKCPIPWSDFS